MELSFPAQASCSCCRAGASRDCCLQRRLAQLHASSGSAFCWQAEAACRRCCHASQAIHGKCRAPADVLQAGRRGGRRGGAAKPESQPEVRLMEIAGVQGEDGGVGSGGGTVGADAAPRVRAKALPPGSGAQQQAAMLPGTSLNSGMSH